MPSWSGWPTKGARTRLRRHPPARCGESWYDIPHVTRFARRPTLCCEVEPLDRNPALLRQRRPPPPPEPNYGTHCRPRTGRSSRSFGQHVSHTWGNSYDVVQPNGAALVYA